MIQSQYEDFDIKVCLHANFNELNFFTVMFYKSTDIKICTNTRNVPKFL
jgi:hypothetical protein